MKLPTHIAIPEIEGLEKDSVVLLEQLRTLDKRRLENYVCTLTRVEMEKINKAIRRSTGIPKIIEKPLVVSLCRVCAGNFYDVPGHYIRRVNPEQRYKDRSEICQGVFCYLNIENEQFKIRSIVRIRAPPTDLNSKKFRLEERSWKADSLKEEKINITHMKSMRRTENIMFHFVMVKKSTRIWK
ncbi:MAG: type II toxin-antitoxin system PemK/MazF family toxin [Blautia sp.]